MERREPGKEKSIIGKEDTGPENGKARVRKRKRGYKKIHEGKKRKTGKERAT